MAPLTYQQQALALLTARDPESAISATNPVTLPRAVKYLDGFAEHVMSFPAEPIPQSVIDQLRHLGSVAGEDSLFRTASDLITYNKIMQHMHKSSDPVGEAANIKKLALKSL